MTKRDPMEFAKETFAALRDDYEERLATALAQGFDSRIERARDGLDAVRDASERFERFSSNHDFMECLADLEEIRDREIERGQESRARVFESVCDSFAKAASELGYYNDACLIVGYEDDRGMTGYVSITTNVRDLSDEERLQLTQDLRRAAQFDFTVVPADFVPASEVHEHNNHTSSLTTEIELFRSDRGNVGIRLGAPIDGVASQVMFNGEAVMEIGDYNSACGFAADMLSRTRENEYEGVSEVLGEFVDLSGGSFYPGAEGFRAFVTELGGRRVPSVNSEAFMIVQSGDLKALREGLADRSIAANEWDGKQTLLHCAVALKNPGMTDALIAAGADLNARDFNGATPLCCSYDSAITNKLLDAGADVNIADDFGRTPLMNACWLGNDRDVHRMLDMGADPNAARSDGVTAVWSALSPRHYAAVKDALLGELKNAGAHLEHVDNEGLTPLDWAVHTKNHDGALALLKAGHAVDPKTKYGVALTNESPLTRAVKNRDSEMVSRLLYGGADPNLPLFDGRTALMDAADRGEPEIVGKLLKAGAKVNCQDILFQTPLFYCHTHQDREVIDMLLNSGADIDHQDRSGATFLQMVVEHAEPGLVRHLIEMGADPNIPDRNGHTALTLIAGVRHFDDAARDKIDALIESGMDVNQVSSDWSQFSEQQSPLRSALLDGAPATVKHLIVRHHANPSVCTENGPIINEALRDYEAGVSGDLPDKIGVLLDAGCNVHVRDALGHSAHDLVRYWPKDAPPLGDLADAVKRNYVVNMDEEQFAGNLRKDGVAIDGSGREFVLEPGPQGTDVYSVKVMHPDQSQKDFSLITHFGGKEEAIDLALDEAVFGRDLKPSREPAHYVYTEKGEQRAREAGIEERPAGTLARFGREILRDGVIAQDWEKQGFVVRDEEPLVMTPKEEAIDRMRQCGLVFDAKNLEFDGREHPTLVQGGRSDEYSGMYAIDGNGKGWILNSKAGIHERVAPTGHRLTKHGQEVLRQDREAALEFHRERLDRARMNLRDKTHFKDAGLEMKDTPKEEKREESRGKKGSFER